MVIIDEQIKKDAKIKELMDENASLCNENAELLKQIKYLNDDVKRAKNDVGQCRDTIHHFEIKNRTLKKSLDIMKQSSDSSLNMSELRFSVSTEVKKLLDEPDEYFDKLNSEVKMIKEQNKLQQQTPKFKLIRNLDMKDNYIDLELEDPILIHSNKKYYTNRSIESITKIEPKNKKQKYRLKSIILGKNDFTITHVGSYHIKFKQHDKVFKFEVSTKNVPGMYV